MSNAKDFATQDERLAGQIDTTDYTDSYSNHIDQKTKHTHTHTQRLEYFFLREDLSWVSHIPHALRHSRILKLPSRYKHQLTKVESTTPFHTSPPTTPSHIHMHAYSYIPPEINNAPQKQKTCISKICINTHTYTHKYMHAHMCMRAHACTHTHTHTHTHIHTVSIAFTGSDAMLPKSFQILLKVALYCSAQKGP